MSMNIRCKMCNKIVMRIDGGAVAKGSSVRCASCEEKLEKELRNLRYLAKIYENKGGNPFADLFNSFK